MKDKEWFESWFNSPYYHVLYKHRDEDEAAFFISNLVSFLNIPPQSAVLDIACGKGRHSITFHKKGYKVIGIDISSESIKAAQKQANQNLQFYVHDMRKLFWVNYFHLAVNLFSSFGYFKTEREHQLTIDNMAKSLKPGGTLVIDFLNVHRVLNSLIKAEEKEIEGITFKIQRSYTKSSITKKISVTDGDKNIEFYEQIKAFELKDFETFIKRAGLQLINVFGDYSLNNFDEKNSERLIIIAKK
jgi:SAM-dependent methyltransferase